jgi:agmatinase
MPNAPVESADVLILPVPLERTVSFKPGTAQAPAAILATTDQLEFFEEDAGWSPFKHLTISVLPAYGDDPALPAPVWHTSLSHHVAGLPQDNLFIALGGEHSVTPSLVASRMPEPGTVLFLDAHGDLRTSYEGSQFSHACPVFRLLEQGHQVVMAGVRSLFEAEAELAEREPRVTLFLDRELRKPEVWQRLLGTIHSLSGPLYLSIDMDAFCPSQVPGVGTPQPGGFSWHQMIDILATLCDRPHLELRGADLVEMVPEASRVSEMVAAKLLQKIISFWGVAHGFHHRPQTGSQMQVSYD